MTLVTLMVPTTNLVNKVMVEMTPMAPVNKSRATYLVNKVMMTRMVQVKNQVTVNPVAMILTALDNNNRVMVNLGVTIHTVNKSRATDLVNKVAMILTAPDNSRVMVNLEVTIHTANKSRAMDLVDKVAMILTALDNNNRVMVNLEMMIHMDLAKNKVPMVLVKLAMIHTVPVKNNVPMALAKLVTIHTVQANKVPTMVLGKLAVTNMAPNLLDITRNIITATNNLEVTTVTAVVVPAIQQANTDKAPLRIQAMDLAIKGVVNMVVETIAAMDPEIKVAQGHADKEVVNMVKAMILIMEPKDLLMIHIVVEIKDVNKAMVEIKVDQMTIKFQS